MRRDPPTTNGAGLSPHLRGNQRLGVCSPASDGSIPALAGEPDATLSTLRLLWVYPRTCGGTLSELAPMAARQGLSPHLRGNRIWRPYTSSKRRSIPALAGEPRADSGQRPHPRVYPRTCGGTIIASGLRYIVKGLSPHLRGNRKEESYPGAHGGSIPALAGEPPSIWAGRHRQKVYPRTCGGTSAGGLENLEEVGLSPHLRGNL